MDCAEIRHNLDLSQAEMALLLGVPERTLQAWETVARNGSSAQKSLYRSIEVCGKDAVAVYLRTACSLSYIRAVEFRMLLGMIASLGFSSEQAESMRESLLSNNPQLRWEK